MAHTGFVSLVGAGPGDPDLLTIKALRLIQQADIVLFDRLVSDAVIDLIPAGVSRISVGKSPGNHSVPQDQINEMLINLAGSGRHLVRLKGGDPYIFGRGGEEAEALRRQGIPFEVVPGITAAAGCSSYSGIPLTHRSLSNGVRFITGHLKNGEDLALDWDKIADPGCTLVIYMGLANLQFISEQLIKAGLPASTPAAAIRGGSTGQQQTVVSTLVELAEAVSLAGLESPVTTIIGRVVTLRDRLNWFALDQQLSAHEGDEIVKLARA